LSKQKKISTIIKANKKRIYSVLRIVFSVLILYYLINFLTENNFSLIFTGSNIVYIFMSFIMIPLNIYLQFKRWELLNNELIHFYDKKQLLNSVFIGISSGLITPFKLGEFFGRASIFKGDLFHKAVSISIFDRLLSMIVTIILGCIVFIYFLFSQNLLPKVNIFISLAVLISVISLIIIFVFKRDYLRNRFKSIDNIYKYFNVMKELTLVTTIKLLILAILFFFTYVIQFALIISSFLGIQNLITFIAIGILVFFTNTVIPPVTFGELGIREGGAVFFMSKFMFNPAVGFSASLILFMFNILIPSLVGLVIYLRQKR